MSLTAGAAAGGGRTNAKIAHGNSFDRSFGGGSMSGFECAHSHSQMSSLEQQQLNFALAQSMNEEANKRTADFNRGFSTSDTQFAINQSLAGSHSISPILTQASAFSALTVPPTTPEHLSTSRDHLMESAMDPMFLDNEDAIQVMSVLDDKTDPARETLLRFSENLHRKGVKQEDTPKRAQSIIDVYKTIKKQKQG